MLSLRPYQTEAIAGIYDWFEQREDNPLIVLPTGAGKSLVIAHFVRGAIEAWTDTRFLVLTHVAELIEQNYAELVGLWPWAPAGIYSAGLRRRDMGKQILFGGIQSLADRAYELPRIDIVLVDECHLIPRKSNTRYMTFLAALKTINPLVKIVGLTATPYRLDSGRLDDGDEPMFGGIAYEKPLAELIAEGYLSSLISKQTAARMDVTGVGTAGGEFVAGQLERAVDVDWLTKACIDEVMDYGADRVSWLLFGAGAAHAEHIAAEVSARGISCAAITKDTPRAQRKELITAHRERRLRALASMNVLTTGFNNRAVDLIAMMRPTKSAGLYVQIAGRGTRLSPETGKRDCLVLDFAGNVSRHGPVDKITPKSPPKKGAGDAPVKECPECQSIIHASLRNCPDCGYEFPPPELKLDVAGTSGPILSTEIIPPEWVKVTRVSYARHEKHGSQPGSPATLQVDYQCGVARHREWLCFEHTGVPRKRAMDWWFKRGGGMDVPATVERALLAAPNLKAPSEIAIKREGKYFRVVDYRFTAEQPPVNAPTTPWSGWAA